MKYLFDLRLTLRLSKGEIPSPAMVPFDELRAGYRLTMSVLYTLSNPAIDFYV
jgi:hypothetical protein